MELQVFIQFSVYTALLLLAFTAWNLLKPVQTSQLLLSPVLINDLTEDAVLNPEQSLVVFNISDSATELGTMTIDESKAKDGSVLNLINVGGVSVDVLGSFSDAYGGAREKVELGVGASLILVFAANRWRLANTGVDFL